MKVHPDECPDCGFVWGAYHGHRYGYGYTQLAARVWRCNRCKCIVRHDDPKSKQVAHL